MAKDHGCLFGGSGLVSRGKCLVERETYKSLFWGEDHSECDANYVLSMTNYLSPRPYSFRVHLVPMWKAAQSTVPLIRRDVYAFLPSSSALFELPLRLFLPTGIKAGLVLVEQRGRDSRWPLV